MERVSPLAGAAALVSMLGLMALGARAPQGPESSTRQGPADAGTAKGNAGGNARRTAAPSSPEARALLEGRPMDLNQASQEDLRLLPRIGPVLAERIAEDRRAQGPYARLEDLRRVSGVGDATVKNLRGLACAGADCPAHAPSEEVEDEAEP
jgi:DNA uptake protein ComE-like DNA-binding protein